MKHIQRLEQRLFKTVDQTVNMTDIVFYHVADTVGDIVCGTNFDMIQSGKKHFAAGLLSSGFKPVGYINPVPWLIVFLMAMPGVLGPWLQVVEWAKKEVARRLSVGSS